MKSMALTKICSLKVCKTPLTFMDQSQPVPKILIKVNACGVCHAEFDEIESHTPLLNLPVIPAHFWMEKEIKSVANVTSNDVSEFITLAAEMNIKPKVQEYSLSEANQALVELKERKIHGEKVLIIN